MTFTVLTEALVLGNRITMRFDEEILLYSQKQYIYQNPDLEYIISLISDCYK